MTRSTSFQSLSTPRVSSDLPSIVVHPPPYFRDVSEAVSDLTVKLEDILKETWPKISTTVSSVDILKPAEPSTRDGFLQYSCPLTLDLNTIRNYISLSEGNRKVTLTQQIQRYPDHPDRFTDCWQILCRKEWSGIQVSTAVSYKDIKRKGMGNDSHLGHNFKSWSLECSTDGYSFRHNNVETKVSGPQSSRVGVYLDHKAGTLSFYSVSDTMTLLHRVQTTFTQPLYPGIWLHYVGDTAELQKL
ncbi:tripartite motif-containing protein 16-like [Aplochiton taeniatus]